MALIIRVVLSNFNFEISKDNVLELYFFSILGLIFVVLVVCIMFFGSGHLLHIAFVADSCVRGRTK